jgi:aminopeptidase-like protein
MKKIIEDLFKFDRQLTGEGFNAALDYINNIIPLKYWKWLDGKVWTWDVPKGGLKLGEFSIGTGKEVILLPIHLDHSKMANDNLSGVAVAIRLAQLIRDNSVTKPIKYTYKFLFLPETIGTIAYLSTFGTNFKYGIVIDSVGGDGDLITTTTKTPSILNLYVEGKTNEFMSDAHLWSGNDERTLESVGIPSIQISRSPFLEYHSERDTPDRIIDKQLNNALAYVHYLIWKIENDFVPAPKYKGVPCLSANGLWKKEYGSPHTFMKVERIWQMLGYGLSVVEIAKATNNTFHFTLDFVNELKSKGLV